MFKCDYHTHTYYSFDGDAASSVDALCKAAIEKGVTDLAVTDHFECNWRAEASYPPYNADAAFAEVQAAKERYKGKLHLTYGIEIGQANQYPEEAKALLAAHDFEFVIGSIHNLTGAPDFYMFDFEKLSVYPGYIGYLFERYIDELCAVIDTLPKLDTVAHLTYMQRYCELSGNHYDFIKHAEKVELLFKKMIAENIALEVNVSTLWKGLGFAMPDCEFLSLYRDCGGRLITVGTDSHSPEHIGDCVEDGFALLKRVGLDSILTVRNGEKTIVKI